MGRTVLALAPDKFVVALARQTAVWRKSNSSAGKAGKRHMRALKRLWIRQYKSRYGIQSLPRYTVSPFGAMSADIEVSPESSVIVLLPQNEHLEEQKAVAADEDVAAFREAIPQATRKQFRYLLHVAAATGSHVSFDLINASHTRRQSMPAVARLKTRRQLTLRGVFLEALGAAILPRLEPAMVEAMEKEGAEILPNTQILAPHPEVAELTAPPDFWHRKILPRGNTDPQPLTGKGVSVGILDTGIDANHREFSHHTEILYREFDVNGAEKPETTKRDFGNHGTHVSAICAGREAGIARDVHLSVAAVLTEKDQNGRSYGYLAQILGGLDWLVTRAGAGAEGVHVVNASLGMTNLLPTEIRSLYNAVALAADQGAIVVAAVGNNGYKGIGNHSFPGKLEHVVAVGAIDRNDQVAPFSDWGYSYGRAAKSGARKPNIVAPGVEIHSALAGGGYVSMSGSSMSAPCVSGALALILEAQEGLFGDPRNLTEALMKFTKQSLTWNHDDHPRVGRGCVHLAGLVLTP